MGIFLGTAARFWGRHNGISRQKRTMPLGRHWNNDLRNMYCNPHCDHTDSNQTVRWASELASKVAAPENQIHSAPRPLHRQNAFQPRTETTTYRHKECCPSADKKDRPREGSRIFYRQSKEPMSCHCTRATRSHRWFQSCILWPEAHKTFRRTSVRARNSSNRASSPHKSQPVSNNMRYCCNTRHFSEYSYYRKPAIRPDT